MATLSLPTGSGFATRGSTRGSTRGRGLFARLLSGVGREIEARRCIETLRGFDDALLADIGIERSAIVRAVREGR